MLLNVRFFHGVRQPPLSIQLYDIEVMSMACEYVLDGEEAVINGKGLLNCQKVVFPGNKEGRIVAEKTINNKIRMIRMNGNN